MGVVTDDTRITVVPGAHINGGSQGETNGGGLAETLTVVVSQLTTRRSTSTKVQHANVSRD